jgi:hypothetical protein
VIHGDANDHNVVVNGDEVELIDFGDLHYTATVCELAIAAAYVALNKKDPLIAIRHLVEGYGDVEIEALFPLILLRLAVSVVNSAHRKALYPNDSYVTVSEHAAWEALRTLEKIHPRLARYTLRLPEQWTPPKAVAAIMEGFDSAVILDMSVGSATEMASPDFLAIGRYNEARLFYTEPMFEGRTIHLGLDLFAPPGTQVFAPLDGTVYAVANNQKRLFHALWSFSGYAADSRDAGEGGAGDCADWGAAGEWRLASTLALSDYPGSAGHGLRFSRGYFARDARGLYGAFSGSSFDVGAGDSGGADERGNAGAAAGTFGREFIDQLR